MPIEKPASCKKEEPCWKCRAFASQKSCPLRSAYKQWEKEKLGGESFSYVLNSTAQTSRDDSEEERTVIVKTKTDKPDTKKRADGQLAAGEAKKLIIAACDLGEQVTITEIKKRTGLKDEAIHSVLNREGSAFGKVMRGVYSRVGTGVAGPPAGAPLPERPKEVPAAASPPSPAVKVLEDYDETRKAHGLEPNLIEKAASGGGNAMSLERELLGKLLDEIEVPPDLRQRMDLIVLLVDRIVG